MAKTTSSKNPFEIPDDSSSPDWLKRSLASRSLIVPPGSDDEPLPKSRQGFPLYSKAQQYLFSLKKEHKKTLKTFALEHGLSSDSSYVYLWQLKQGRRYPSHEIINLLSDIIPKRDWQIPADPLLPMPEKIKDAFSS